MDRTAIEEELAHLRRTVDDLSELCVRQQSQIDRLSRRVDLLVRRAAEAEADAPGAVVLGDERPPHW
jgi:SlyX protein